MTYLFFEGDPVEPGQAVFAHVEGSVRRGVVVIAPGQLVEYHGPEPRGHAELDLSPRKPPLGSGVELLLSLNLPDNGGQMGT